MATTQARERVNWGVFSRLGVVLPALLWQVAPRQAPTPSSHHWVVFQPRLQARFQKAQRDVVLQLPNGHGFSSAHGSV